MYKIGEFSKISKTTIKALRYYEKEQLLKPIFVDPNTGYRYYETSQLVELSKILALRQIGISIKDIKKYLNGANIKILLSERKKEIESNLILYNIELSKINYLLEEKFMNNEIILKQLPEYIVYYKEGTIEDYSKMTGFVLSAGEECQKANPNIKCVTPGYCYVNYLDGQYKESNIKIRYAEAVVEKGIETEQIKFMDVASVPAICIYHKGAYETLRESYGRILKYIEDNKYEIIDCPRECYIDGCWNKESVTDWLTEIQIPVKKK